MDIPEANMAFPTCKRETPDQGANGQYARQVTSAANWGWTVTRYVLIAFLEYFPFPTG